MTRTGATRHKSLTAAMMEMTLDDEFYDDDSFDDLAGSGLKGAYAGTLKRLVLGISSAFLWTMRILALPHTHTGAYTYVRTYAYTYVRTHVCKPPHRLLQQAGLQVSRSPCTGCSSLHFPPWVGGRSFPLLSADGL